MKITSQDLQKLVSGSRILGSGGGGSWKEGLETAKKALAMGDIELISVDELLSRGGSGVVVTMSGVGSPASPEAYYSPEVYPRILELLKEQLPAGTEIDGFISCEIGGSSSFEPFIPAALEHKPIIDAPCDGRAHPFGLMGALGLEKTGQNVVQAAAGGKPETNRYLEIAVNASVESASNLIRSAASEAGGAVAVARNPVSCQWLKDAGAAGAYAQAMELGEVWAQNGTSLDKAARIAEALHGELVCSGAVSDYELVTENALDHGSFTVNDDGLKHKVYFFNEYMALDFNGERSNTFPDVIVTLDSHTGEILTTADIRDGLDIMVLSTDHSNVSLGKGLHYRSCYKKIESILGIEMISYLDKNGFFLD